MSYERNPGVSFGMMNPRIPSSVLAQTIATSATEPLVIHILWPLMIQSVPLRRAIVRMDPGSEPASDSVNPKHPMDSPVAIEGSHSSHCSIEPHLRVASIANDPCTDTMLRTPLSPASSSKHARPYAVALAPAQPNPFRCIPNTPSDPNPLINSTDPHPSSNHVATNGSTFSRTYCRMVRIPTFSNTQSGVFVHVSG